ncbi:unnamed protein product [Rhodiola kirilowii]
MAKSFKSEHPLERRQAEASRIREKYPDQGRSQEFKLTRAGIFDNDINFF